MVKKRRTVSYQIEKGFSFRFFTLVGRPNFIFFKWIIEEFTDEGFTSHPLVFDGKKKLLPKTTDLSYFNWRTNACYANDSPNFKVDASNGN